MFSSLPSLGGLLPTSTPSSASLDSLRFKTDRQAGLARLYTEAVPATDHRFWSSIVTHFRSAQHAFDTFSVKDARAIRDRQPRNFRTLLGLLTLHLESLKGDERFARRPGMKGDEDDGEDASTSDSAGYVAGLTAGLGKWAAAPFGGSGSSSSTRRPRDRTQEALSCARLLARLLPVLMEDTGVATDAQNDLFASPLEEDILWSRHTIVEEVAAATDTPAAAPSNNLADETSDQFVIDDEDEVDESKASQDPLSDPSSSSSTPAQPSPPAAQPQSPPLAERLIHLTLDFLFFPGFTLPHLSPDEEEDADSPDGSRVRHTIWSQGVGSSVSLPNTTREHVAHRVEFLRLLVVLLSKAVYVAPPAQERFRDRALEYACTSLSRTVTLPLLCSLLNAACAEVGAGAGWGLPGFVGGAGGASEAEGSSEMLRTLSLQLLAVLLDWQPRSVTTEGESSLDVSQQSTDSARPDLSRTTSTATTSSSTSTLAAPIAASSTSLGSNQFAYWTSKVHRPSDLLLLSTRLFSLLRPASSSNAASSSSSFNLPSLVTSTTSAASAALGGPSSSGSSAGLPSVAGVYIHAPEALTLLWRLLRLNTKFRSHVLADPIRAPTLLGLLLSHALMGKDSPPSHGMVRLAIFVLHDVSATPDPAFGEHIAAKGSQRHCELPSRVINAPGSLLAGGAGGIASAQSAGDVLVACCHALVSTRGMGAGGAGGGTGAPGLALTPAILISLANLAPALRKLSVSSAAKLGQLLAHVSRPAFLLADEGNPRCCFFLLEACNAILTGGEEEVRGNANVVYALLGRGREVKRLRGFELGEGLREIEGMRRGRSGTMGGEGEAGMLMSAEEEKRRIREQEVQSVAPSEGEGEASGEAPSSASPPAATAAAAAATPTQLSEKAQGKVRSDGIEDAKLEGEALASASNDKDPLTSQSPPGDTPAQPSSSSSSVAPATPPLDESQLLPLIHSLNLYNPRTGFYPTPQWVSSWAPHLPLGPLGALHDDEGLRKELEERSKKGGADEAVRWLRSEEGVGRIRAAVARGLDPTTTTSSTSSSSSSPAAAPSPRPPRPFRWTPAVDVWLRSFIWGAVYVLQAHKAYCLWPDEGVRLFYLVVQGQQGRGRGGSVLGQQGQREVGREGERGAEGKGMEERRVGTKDEGTAQEGAAAAAAGQGEASLTAEKGEAIV